MTEETTTQIARIIDVHFGRVGGVFGLHLRLTFQDLEFEDYAITDLAEMEQIMDSFKANCLGELINRRMRLRRFPPRPGTNVVLPESSCSGAYRI